MSQWNYPAYRPGGNDTTASDDFMPLLSNLSKEELEELMNNEDRINEIVCDQDKVKQIKLDIELIQAENRSLADHTIEKEPLLNELRKTLSEKYENVQQLNEVFQVNQAKLESLQKDINLEAMLNVLQAKCAMSEEKSEELAEQFYDKKISLTEFIDQFKKRKTEAHLRRIKADKMRELVIEAQRHGANIAGVSNSPSTHVPAAPGYPASGMPLTMPYPQQYKW